MKTDTTEIGTRFETAARTATRNPELWVPGVGNGSMGGVLAALVEARLTDQEIGQLVRSAVTGEQSPSAEQKADWQAFRYFSEYYGSHPERGGADIVAEYRFRPGVDLSRWDGVKFAHGEVGELGSNHEFENWLDILEEGVDYVEL